MIQYNIYIVHKILLLVVIVKPEVG